MEFVLRAVGIFLLVISAKVGRVNSQICTNNWKLHDDTYYLEDATKRTYDNAKRNCRRMGAELAFLKSPEENDFVQDLNCRPSLDLYRYWIGLTDLLHENSFEWEDGTKLDPRNVRWGPGEPNNRYDQDCVAFITSPDYNSHGKWSTEVCSSNLFSLCSKPLVLPGLSQPPEVHDVGTDSFRLSWQCWNEAEDKGDGPVLGYRIHVKTIKDPTVASWSTVGFVLHDDPCEFFVEHLHTNTEYNAAVSILHGDSRREGPLGPVIRVSTHDVVLPELLQPPEVHDVGTDSFRLSWQCWNEAEDKGDGPVLGYRIHVKMIQDPTVASWSTVGFVLNDDPCEFFVEHLHTNTEYNAAVSILHGDSRREGPLGPVIRVSTHDVELPVLLEPPEAIDIGTSYVVITWTKWTGKVGEGDGPIAGYSVRINDGAVGRKLASAVTFDANLKFNVTCLLADMCYQITITVIYQDGRPGPPGPVLSVSTTTTPTEEPTKNGTIPSSPTLHPDCIYPVKLSKDLPCETRAKRFFVMLMSFGAGVVFIMSIIIIRKCCQIRGTVSSKGGKEDTTAISPDRQSRPFLPDAGPPSYKQAILNM